MELPNGTQTNTLWRRLAIILAPSAANAEKTWRIAFFSVAAGPNYLADAFRQGLRDLGYVEGRDLTIDYRWMAGREDHYRDVARELSDGTIDLIVTTGHPAALAAKAATSRVPIVALAVVDPGPSREPAAIPVVTSPDSLWRSPRKRTRR